MEIKNILERTITVGSKALAPNEEMEVKDDQEIKNLIKQNYILKIEVKK